MLGLWIVLYLSPGSLLAGVAQARSANRSNTTNIGTNPYKDMNMTSNTNANAGPYYTTVNPNYSDHSTVYHGDTVATDPGYAYDGYDSNYGANYNGYNTVITGGYYNDYNSWSAGSTVANAPIPMGVVLQYAPASAMPIMVGGARYYYDNTNNVYFQEVFDGGAVVYEVVPAPYGAVITVLPSGCVPQYFNGKSFMLCGATYYKQVAGGYEVVAAN